MQIRKALAIVMLLCGAASVQAQMVEGRKYLLKNRNSDLCLQAQADGRLTTETCNHAQEAQRFWLYLDAGQTNITTDPFEHTWAFSQPQLASSGTLTTNNNAHCLGVDREGKSPGSLVVRQGCYFSAPLIRPYLMKHNQWGLLASDEGTVVQPSGIELICPGDDYVSVFQTSALAGMLDNIRHQFGAARFCTDPRRLMIGDRVLVKVPGGTLRKRA